MKATEMRGPSMRKILYAGLGILVLVLLCIAGVVLLFSPAQGPFSEKDLQKLKMGMTLTDVEATFGPSMRDAESGLVPRSEGAGFWQGWKGETYDLHVLFDAQEHLQGAVLHPRAPLRIHQVMLWFRR